MSLLFRSSRAELATTGMHALRTEMRRRHHRAQRRFDRTARIGEKVGDAGERFVGLGVEHMQDGSDQQRMAGLLPMVPPFERAFGIDQHVGDVLHVAYFPFAAADLQQRIVGGARRVGRIEQQNAAELARAIRQSSVQFSPLMSWTIAEPGQVSSVGTTRPTPLPDRVGAKQSTCSGPSWRR